MLFCLNIHFEANVPVIVKSVNLFYMLSGVTASGLFSQSAITTKNKPLDVKTSPNSSAETFCDNSMRNSSLPSNVDTNDHRQERIEIMEARNQMIIYSGDRSYDESQVMTVKSQGTLHAFTVALALSVHSIFEGLAFGLQDSINQVCNM